ncbi:hypothetical protein ABID26_005868 [Mesorhizobium shonense]|uniref:Uncharacterized protein n=1 Tax=Mesorhizobium shonense TaxID=1209948 RepID=A0ABV2I0M0_9HYPH
MNEQYTAFLIGGAQAGTSKRYSSFAMQAQNAASPANTGTR